MSLLHRLWNDEAGFIVSAELILIATVLVIGMLVGLATVRDNIVMELADVADAFSEIVQSYSFSGITGHSSSTAGSLFIDQPDFCETGAAGAGSDQSPNNEVLCLAIAGVNGTPE
jgi:ABC-type dipeptide/oligopeptide/nickel transport system permease subunit